MRRDLFDRDVPETLADAREAALRSLRREWIRHRARYWRSGHPTHRADMIRSRKNYMGLLRYHRRSAA